MALLLWGKSWSFCLSFSLSLRGRDLFCLDSIQRLFARRFLTKLEQNDSVAFNTKWHKLFFISIYRQSMFIKVARDEEEGKVLLSTRVRWIASFGLGKYSCRGSESSWSYDWARMCGLGMLAQLKSISFVCTDRQSLWEVRQVHYWSFNSLRSFHV